jgi:hypothetical protein
MTGKEIFNRDTSLDNEYCQLLLSIESRLGSDVLFPFLESAEKQSKKIAIDETNVDVSIFDNDIAVNNIILV